MGFDPVSIAFMAFTGLKAISSISAGNAAGKQTIAQGEIDAQQRANVVRYTAAKQTAAFLASGVTLEGTPTDVQNETFKTGLQDVDNIRAGADAKAKNQISTGRGQAIGDIMGSLAGASMSGSIGSMFQTGVGDATNALGLNGAGQDVGSFFSKSAEGPFKPFGI